MAEKPTQLDRIEKKVDRVCDWIYSTDPQKPGADKRLDRLERDAAGETWWRRTIAGAAVAAIAAWVWQLIAGR